MSELLNHPIHNFFFEMVVYFAFSKVELVSTLLGILSVYLVIRRNIWCWPIGFLWALTSIWVFKSFQMYSDMWLGAVYCFLQLYGWYAWLYGGEDNTELKVHRLSFKGLILSCAIGAVAVPFWGQFILYLYPDASVPYWDATTTIFSLIAQFLMTRKLIDNWFFWIFVDTLCVFIYIYKGMNMYAFLYGIFDLMAIAGAIEWYKVMKNNQNQETNALLEPETA